MFFINECNLQLEHSDHFADLDRDAAVDERGSIPGHPHGHLHGALNHPEAGQAEVEGGEAETGARGSPED